MVIWDGTGELPEGAVHFTGGRRDCRLYGRKYVRARASKHLSRYWRHTVSLADRERAIRETVDNDAWLSGFNGMLVSAVCRAAEEYMMGMEKEQPKGE